MSKIFKIINNIWKIIFLLLTIIFLLYTLISALALMTIKNLSFTEWLALVVSIFVFSAMVYLTITLYKLHTQSIEQDEKQKERDKKQQELINSLNDNDPTWQTIRKLNILEDLIKKELKEIENEKINKH